MKYLAIMACCCALGCAASEKRPEFPEPVNEDDPAARAEAASRPAATVPAHGLTRQRLAQILDAGPAAFLRGLHVRAHLNEEKFQGWEIVSLDDPDLRAGELLPGDVVVAVNGKGLEYPEQLGDVFDLLRTAPEIVVSYRRAGAERTLRIPVVE